MFNVKLWLLFFFFLILLKTCVRVVEVLEKARQYKAVFAMYRLMDKYGYDFYENEVLNGNIYALLFVYLLWYEYIINYV